MQKFFWLSGWLWVISSWTTPAYAQFAQEAYRAGAEKDTTDGRRGLTEIYFVGTGDIQLAYTQAKDSKGIAANTGLGVLLWRIWDDGTELQLDAKVNVASTVDTIFALDNNGLVPDNRLFGRYLLVPAGSGQATFISTLYYYDRPGMSRSDFKALGWKRKAQLYIDGMEISAAGSNQIWASYKKNASNNSTEIVKSTNASVLSLRAGLFHEFIPQTLRRQKGYSIRLGGNFIVRSLQGDIGRNGTATREMREYFILSKATIYAGGELNLGLRLKNIRAEASLPYLFPGKSPHVPGLTGAQFITSISFVGGFPLSITK